MADATKRMSFFDRQFLRAADFQDEQAYHIDRRRRHNRLLHSPGVAGQGLKVSGNKGEGFVTVASGTGYDERGQEIVLAGDGKVDVSQIQGASAYITIAYSEQPTDASTDPGVTGNSTRWSEVPALSAISKLPDNPNLTLVLAKVPLANGKVDGAPDNSVRASAGTVLGDDLTLSSLTVKTTVKAAAFQGDGSALTGVSATDNTKVAKSGDTMTGPLAITGNTTAPLVTVTQSGTTGNPVGLSVNAVGAAVDGIGIVGLRGTAKSAGGFGIVGNAGPAGSIAGQFNGDVGVTGNVDLNGALRLANSDLYFTKADHKHTAFGNTPGFAAIENAADFGALMILGRSTGPSAANPQRVVKLWDQVGIGMGFGAAAPSRTLHVEGNEIHSGGGGGGFSFADRSTGSFVEGPTKGERWVWYAREKIARLWSGGLEDKVTVNLDGEIHAAKFIVTGSDARFKTNIKPLKNVLEKLEKIRGVSFDWNKLYASLGRSTGRREIGVLAQEVEAVFPELVTTWGDQGYKALDYSRLTVVLIEALKELKAANNALEERIEALEKATEKKGKSTSA